MAMTEARPRFVDIRDAKPHANVRARLRGDGCCRCPEFSIPQ
jgi:hypothetical protein